MTELVEVLGVGLKAITDALSKQGRLLQELVELEVDKVELMQLDQWMLEDGEDEKEEETEEGEEVEVLQFFIHSYLFFFGLIFSFLCDYSSLPRHQPTDHTCLYNRFLPSNSSHFYDSPLFTHMYFFVILSHSTMFHLFPLYFRTFQVSGI